MASHVKELFPDLSYDPFTGAVQGNPHPSQLVDCKMQSFTEMQITEPTSRDPEGSSFLTSAKASLTCVIHV